MTKTALLFASFAALLLVGCTPTIDQRIQQRQAIFDSYPEDLQERIRQGNLRLGDTKDAVWMVYGEPKEKSVRVDANGTTETWTYKILGYNDSLYPSVRPVYHDVRGNVRGSYFIRDTPEYEWKSTMSVEFVNGKVTAVQTYD